MIKQINTASREMFIPLVKGVYIINSKKVIVYYRVAWVFAIFFGAVLKISLVWNISDAANALMAIPNLIMVLMLSGVIAKETRKYLWDNNLDTVDTEMVR